MTNRDVDRLAEAYGILATYVSEQGELREVSRATRRRLLEAMGVDDSGTDPPPAITQPVTDPGRCYVPPFLRRGRAWGVTCQLYGLRSSRNWGIGDFEDLARLAEIVAARGGDFLGVNPLHALFPTQPERCSPYSPSSRRFLNVLYIAPDMEPEFAHVPASFRENCRALRRSRLVRYTDVARLKLSVLETMHRAFRASGDPARHAAFQAFRTENGEALERHATFEALAEHVARRRGRPIPWQDWPAQWRRPDSADVRAFAATYDERLEFFAWLQWLAHIQLRRARLRAEKAGMRIGLYLDLAVGVAPDGAMAWLDPDLMVRGVHIGAPPDAFNSGGQDWGLVPQHPWVLAQRDFAPFRDDLAACMRHAGAIRIDHAMAVDRLFWVPVGVGAADGGYVRYPFSAMLAAIAEESRLHRSLVIGEALGTVPEGFRSRLADAEIQAYRVLLFEQRRDGGFRRPRAWPRRALACVSTHDLPTLRGWWRERDIDWRRKAGMISGEEAAAQRRRRATERQQLWQALIHEKLVTTALPADDLPAHGLVAAHLYLSRSPARLVTVQMEDALGEIEQANLPGASDPHPNWRRKLSTRIEELQDHPTFDAVMRAMMRHRPRPVPP